MPPRAPRKKPSWSSTTHKQMRAASSRFRPPSGPPTHPPSRQSRSFQLPAAILLGQLPALILILQLTQADRQRAALSLTKTTTAAILPHRQLPSLLTPIRLQRLSTYPNATCLSRTF